MEKTQYILNSAKLAIVDAKIMNSQHVINAKSGEFSFTFTFSLLT
jgi:hypothetical protein